MASMTPAVADGGDRAFFGHPRGLSTLFFTEMWERFSYYGMKAFLVLYMVAPTNKGGLGFSDATAGIIFGLYTSSVYLLSVPGGWIADRFLGLQRAVFIGGVLIMAGHVVLALPIAQGFYIGLALVALGTGFLKPNISAMVGQLYPANDIRRDAGYSIYYMGINLGAFVAPLVCGFLAESNQFRDLLSSVGLDPDSAWHFGFGAAAVGMALGLAQYAHGVKHLHGAGARPTPPANDAERARNKLILIAAVVATFAVPALIVLLHVNGIMKIEDSFTFLLSGLSIALFAILTATAQSDDERRRLGVIMVLFAGAAVFWACFEQAGSTLTLFADRYTENTLLGFEFPVSWFQSLNALFVITLAPVFAALWVWLGRRGKDPSSPAKFAVGLFLVGLGFAVMLPPAMAIDGDPTLLGAFVGVDHTPMRVSPGWLVMLYFVHTAAEMCLSPVGLSSMSKLAPARLAGLVMGIWFLASSVGNFLSGRAVEFSSSASSVAFFTGMIIFPAVMGVILLTLVKPIRRMLAKTSAPANA